MKTLTFSHSVTVSGEIIETLERKGECMAKIGLETIHVFVPIETISDAHLGDKVKVTITIQNVDLEYNKKVV